MKHILLLFLFLIMGANLFSQTLVPGDKIYKGDQQLLPGYTYKMGNLYLKGKSDSLLIFSNGGDSAFLFIRNDSLFFKDKTGTKHAFAGQVSLLQLQQSVDSARREISDTVALIGLTDSGLYVSTFNESYVDFNDIDKETKISGNKGDGGYVIISDSNRFASSGFTASTGYSMAVNSGTTLNDGINISFINQYGNEGIRGVITSGSEYISVYKDDSKVKVSSQAIEMQIGNNNELIVRDDTIEVLKEFIVRDTPIVDLIHEHSWFLDSETATKSVYYSTTGSDITGNGTIGNPFSTPVKCLQSLKKIINNGVVITITPAAGTYAIDGYELQKELRKFILLGTGQIIFTGGYTVLTNGFTLAAGNPSAYEYTITGGTWTDNQYRDKLLRSAANNFYGIISNSTNSVRTLTGASASTEVVEFNVIWNITNNLYIHLDQPSTNSSAAIIFELMQLNFSTTAATLSVKNTLCNIRRCQIIAGSVTTYTNDLLTFNLVSMVFSSGGINVHKYGQIRNTTVRKSGTKTGTGITYDIDYYRNQHNVYVKNYTTGIQSSAAVVNWNQTGGDVVIDSCTNAFAVRMGSQINFSSLAKLYIVGVDYVISSVTDVVAYNYSVRVSSLTGTPSTDYLTTALKAYGYNNAERNINVIIPGIYTESSTVYSTTLANNSSGNINIGDTVQNSAIYIEYAVKRGTLYEIGNIIMTGGNSTSLDSVRNTKFDDCGLTFNKNISGSTIRLGWTTTSTGTAATLYMDIRRKLK